MSKTDTDLSIPARDAELKGNLQLPEGATGLVVFAHGSGSSRHSPRNLYVAKEFNNAGFGTLLFDLLTEVEEEVDMETAQYRFNIKLLAQRLADVTRWLRKDTRTGGLKLGYFGASTGAAAALIAAAVLPEEVSVVVSRGGRPDLAWDYLALVEAPTLLLVGGLDEDVVELNKKAQSIMHSPTQLTVVAGATHLFEEPGKLEEVARLSVEWFKQYLQ